MIKPTKMTFKGVIPGVEAHCTGSVTLEVVFGSPDNFRCEELIFDIVLFRSGYHALLRRTAFARFNAVPHYAYLKLKMPSTKGILTIVGDYKKSIECAVASSRLAESLVIAAEKRLLEWVVAMAGKQPEVSPNPKESEAEGSFKPAKETKKIPWIRSTQRGTLS